MKINSHISVVVNNSTHYLGKREKAFHFKVHFLSLFRKKDFHDYLLFYKNHKVLLTEPNLEIWNIDKKSNRNCRPTTLLDN